MSNNNSSVRKKTKSRTTPSHVADRTHSKLTQQAKDALVGEMNWNSITKTSALTMHKISEWSLVGSEDADYVNPVTFGKAWNHQDKDKRR